MLSGSKGSGLGISMPTEEPASQDAPTTVLGQMERPFRIRL